MAAAVRHVRQPSSKQDAGPKHEGHAEKGEGEQVQEAEGEAAPHHEQGDKGLEGDLVGEVVHNAGQQIPRHEGRVEGEEDRGELHDLLWLGHIEDDPEHPGPGGHGDGPAEDHQHREDHVPAQQ